MSIVFPDPMKHPDWTPPQTKEFYERLVKESGSYAYPWKSEFDEPTAEIIFGRKLSSYITDSSQVLDVGCGHGDFLNKWASQAKEAVGIDAVEGFIITANRCKPAGSFRFLTIDVDDGLPFSDHYFDVVYSKKGPWLFTERNREGSRVIKPGGAVLQFIHGGTDGGLRALFPGLYSPLNWNKDQAIQQLSDHLGLPDSGLSDIDIQVIEETEYLSTPEDVLIKKCFGQTKSLKEFVWRECFGGVEEIFNKHAAPRGLRVTNYYYIVTARSI
ncbi:class I SAM-dependent methyltransferase [Paenibacillus sp. sptzw28]|uniref:class I SAM-dependent methyltransferase n=1 Tax=Paenibacillus sp. sptzw28 TaxID=715179 RepID=UPI001C6EB085|nr:class I SAM-dependent methyltransferase [Paenibacillus sp. sptzw28]QYR21979.1 class I SAM-dependent methyltransferase [Paenibacillus sp. sptzw28]